MPNEWWNSLNIYHTQQKKRKKPQILTKVSFTADSRNKVNGKIVAKISSPRKSARKENGAERNFLVNKLWNFIKLHPPSFCIFSSPQCISHKEPMRFFSITIQFNMQFLTPPRKFYSFYSFIKIIFTHQYNESFMLLRMASLGWRWWLQFCVIKLSSKVIIFFLFFFCSKTNKDGKKSFSSIFLTFSDAIFFTSIY